jgi:hypothetical protein
MHINLQISRLQWTEWGLMGDQVIIYDVTTSRHNKWNFYWFDMNLVWYEKLSRSLIGKVELISVLHYLYKMNQDPSTGKVNPFERMFANETELLEVVHEMNEEFHPSHFKFWADQGFLMMNRDHEYSYLMLAVLMKILTVGEKHISLVESTALQYPFGNLATLFESIFAEGLECNLLKKQLTGIYTVPNLNLENLSIEFIVNHVNIVYKIHPDLFGNGKVNCLT